MGSAMLSGWLESGIAGGGVFVVEPIGAPAEFDGIGGVSAGPTLFQGTHHN